MPFEFRPANRENVWLLVGLAGGTGSGKAQPVYSNVLTPYGWSHIGDLSVGDSVIGADGDPHLVCGVFPQGEKEAFEVIFSDGSRTECCEDHLWLTQTFSERKRGKSGKVRSLREINETLQLNRGRNNHTVPMVSPVNFDLDHEFVIPPYTMGVLLGDGGFRGSGLVISNPEEFILNEVRASLPENYSLVRCNTEDSDYSITHRAGHKNGWIQELKRLKLWGLKSTDKFIPDSYLYSSRQSRLAVLQGLMDTDGTTSGSSIEYSTSSPHLVNGASFITKSLGGNVTVKSRIPAYVYKGEQKTGSESYRVTVKIPGNIPPFRLPRKSETYIPKTKYQPSRRICEINPIGKRECVCISVASNDGLYVTDDFIVTHNTYSAMRLAKGLSGGKDFAVIDTEAGRAKHYAPRDPSNPQPGEFAFQHLDLSPPFSPSRYLEAIIAAEKAGFPVIVVDSMSHEHAGDGGLLDMHEAALDKMAGNDFGKRQSCMMAAWIQPKQEHKRMVSRLLQLRAHLILCFRAESKIEMRRNDRGKMEAVPKQSLTGYHGWIPVCEKNLPYELTTSFMFTADTPGIPKPIKLQDQHKPFFDLSKPITEECGLQLGKWARGEMGGNPLLSQIQNAPDMQSLKSLAPLCKNAPENQKPTLREAYKRRERELEIQSAGEESQEPPDSEPESQETPELSNVAQEFLARIEEAEDGKSVDAIILEAQQLHVAGKLTSEEFAQIKWKASAAKKGLKK